MEEWHANQGNYNVKEEFANSPSESVDRKLAQTHHQLLSNTSCRMEAIKKKMQAMKVEKDNACDRVDVCEEQCKAARVNSRFGIL